MSKLVCLVTGGSRGIGAALVESLLSEGHSVITCSREVLENGAPKSGNLPDGCEYIQADVSVEKDVKNMIRSIKKNHGRLDVLINNAGMAAMNHILLTPGSTFEKLLRVNTLGTFLVSREAAKLMRNQDRGRIINLTTVAVPLNLEGEGAYVASKAGVEALTKVMAREIAPQGITVNAIGPVPIATDLIRNVPKDKIEDLLERQAIKRLGTFEDVENIVDFLIRPQSDFITGQIIYLGGVS